MTTRFSFAEREPQSIESLPLVGRTSTRCDGALSIGGNDAQTSTKREVLRAQASVVCHERLLLLSQVQLHLQRQRRASRCLGLGSNNGRAPCTDDGANQSLPDRLGLTSESGEGALQLAHERKDAIMERTDYDKQAQDFLDKHGLTIRAAFKGDRCPPWDDHKRGCTHGDRYRVTIKRNAEEFGSSITAFGPRSISFDYWNSYHDMRESKRPTAYDVLTTVGSDSQPPTDADEVLEEYGPMKIAQARLVATFARRLQDFFTEQELEDLSEIN